ncbi:MAG: M20/M25/M40 family metallo-hydrolase [Phycisphaerales bacterium]|nr:M20/M25/M40 family metallo-hydrolase [Phycisphaerales bacterium]
MKRSPCVTPFVLVVVPLTGCASTPRWPVDLEIKSMVREVNVARIEADVRTLTGFGTRNTMSDTASDTRGIGAARRWIHDQFQHIAHESCGRLIVELDGYTQEPDGNRIVKTTEIVNVVATLPGRQPESADRVYIVSAHYDSMASDPKDYTSDAPGADDDASGVACVLELARVMSRYEFDATVVFMAVAGEEQGLLGSKYAAQKSKDAGVHVAAMLTNDIIGNSLSADGVRDRRRVRVFSEGVPLSESPDDWELRQKIGGENDSPARQIARHIDTACDAYVPDFDVVMIARGDRFLRGGDHKPYSLMGYPGVRFTEMNEDYRHQHQNVRTEEGVFFGDVPDRLDYPYIANVTRVNLAALASLARAPARPRHALVMTDRLDHHTALQWNANAEPDLAGYEIVWRETTAAQWQHAVSAGNVTRCKMTLSKDNFIFGVRAVDEQGHRSEAAYPWPSKN